MLFVSLFFRSLSTNCRWIRSSVWIVPILSWTSSYKKFQDDDNKTFNSYHFHLYGLCCADEQDIEKDQHMKLAFEGYLHATLFHGIFYIIPSDFADDDSVKIPGTVKTTKLQFKKLIIPTGQLFQRKLCQHAIGFVIVVIVSYFL